MLNLETNNNTSLNLSVTFDVIPHPNSQSQRNALFEWRFSNELTNKARRFAAIFYSVCAKINEFRIG